jgi:hypothetical protein
MKKDLETVVKELLLISKDLSKGLTQIVIPSMKPSKPKWCQCKNCGGWHYKAN